MINANTPAYPFVEETKTEQYNGAKYTTATSMTLGLSKREELSARFAAELIHVYFNTVDNFNTEVMLKRWAEASVEMADALIKQWEK